MISDYILKPSDVTRTWKAARMKEELIEFFQELYKPASQYEEEKVEYNQITILAEYQMYNMIYAKNELMFDDFKISVVLDIFWKLLEFNPEDYSTKKSKISASETLKKEPDLNTITPQKEMDAHDHKMFPY